MRARFFAVFLLVLMPADGQYRGGFVVRGPSVNVRSSLPAQPQTAGFSGGTNRERYRSLPSAGPGGLRGHDRSGRFGPGYILPYDPGWGYSSAPPIYYDRDEPSGA